MTIKIGQHVRNFSFVESLTHEVRDPFQDKHFQNVLDDIHALEQWMHDHNIQNNWSLQEKLAFLRNVESTIRTGSAVRRTQLAWFALAAGTVAAVAGFLLGLSA